MGTKCRSYVDIKALHPEVSGSCFHLTIRLPDRAIVQGVIDCGIFQEKNYEQFNNDLLFEPKELDFVAITHNHVDHVGRLPMLVAKGYNKRVFCTEDTKTLMKYALTDSLKTLGLKARKNNVKPLYDEKDVENTLELVEGEKFNRTVSVHENVKLTFIPNGHLPGAAMIFVQIVYLDEVCENLLFTGDYNSQNMFFNVNVIPRWIRELPLTVITESTYGSSEELEKGEKVPVLFYENVSKAVKDGKNVIIPAFALGRSQEVLYHLRRLQQLSKLSKKVPIYLDGKLAIEYMKLYKNRKITIKQSMQNFLPDNFKIVDQDTRQQLLYDIQPKIIVTTSGMGTYGPAMTYIPHFVQQRDALIHFTGYCAEGTMGRKLKDAPNNEFIMLGENDSGLLVMKRADVEYTTEFSAHSKSNNLIKLLTNFSNLRSVIVNHGEKKTKMIFAEKVYTELGVKNVGIIDRETIFRVGEYGIVKTISV